MKDNNRHRVSPLLPCNFVVLLGTVLVLGGLFSTGAMAQVQINSSPNVVGSGARALGMGGAFIAVADDATAASWNPGGLTQLERPEFSAVYSWKFFSEDFDKGVRLSPGDSEDVDFDEFNYISFVYPFQRTIAGRNLVFSLNYQQKFDFDRKLTFMYKTSDVFFDNLFSQKLGRIEFHQDGSLGAISPAFGFELTDRLSLGVVMNIWDQSLIPSNEWQKTTRTDDSWLLNRIILTRTIQEERYEDFKGINYTFGLLYKPTERWSIGAVYHTAFAADVDYVQKITALGGANYVTVVKQRRRIEFPNAYGLGIAYRFPNDKLTLALDVTRREWDKFVEIEKGPSPIFQGRRFSPITGLPKWRSYHEPTYTVRMGAEYLFIDTNKPMPKYLPSLRLGAFYDPEPASQASHANSGGVFQIGKTGKPDEYWGATLGLGLLIKNRVNLDFAYIYRWGENVRKDTFSMWDVDADVTQHEFYLSTVIYF
ncbi:MAG TPA: outer membrane protein transport protein [Candidatus Hydrogenedentes bacterium]|nr:outer membrane protein transport protein [Candidatus Hydrogenedentota bacterium]HPO84774.1 outer membrane protein transport protein [Candidatus Hydrogenedentota bacterium]